MRMLCAGTLALLVSTAAYADTLPAPLKPGRYDHIYLKEPAPFNYSTIYVDKTGYHWDMWGKVHTDDPMFIVFNKYPPGHEHQAIHVQWIQFIPYPGGGLNYARANCGEQGHGADVSCHFTLNKNAGANGGDGLASPTILAVGPHGEPILFHFDLTPGGTSPPIHVEKYP